jgi:hypothetical protein
VALAAGEAPEARAHLEAADAALEDIAFPADRQRTERFLRLTRRAAGLLPPPTPDEVEAAAATAPDLRQWPQPAELAELLLAAERPNGVPSWAGADHALRPVAPAHEASSGRHAPRGAEYPLIMWLERHWLPQDAPAHPAYLQLGVTACARAVVAGSINVPAFRALAASLVARLSASADEALVAPLRTFADGGPPEPAIAVALY